MTSTRELKRNDREAAAWFARLKTKTISVAELEQFKAWRADPARKQAYEAVESVWRQSDRLGTDADIADALARTPARRRQRIGKRSTRVWAISGLVAVAMGAVVVGVLLSTPRAYSTGVGQRLAVQLDDGSLLHLDTDSRVEVRYSRTGRNLVLSRGQALFDVAPDVDRPFLVKAGLTSVRALGTRFDVRRDGGRVQVTLIEGRVDVVNAAQTPERWRLAPGEQITTRSKATGQPAHPRKVDAEAVSSWTEGRIEFQATPLATAVAEMNRYTVRPITLDAADYARKPVSGAFDTGKDAAFADAVAHIYGLRVETTADGGIALRSPVQ